MAVIVGVILDVVFVVNKKIMVILAPKRFPATPDHDISEINKQNSLEGKLNKKYISKKKRR